MFSIRGVIEFMICFASSIEIPTYHRKKHCKIHLSVQRRITHAILYIESMSCGSITNLLGKRQSTLETCIGFDFGETHSIRFVISQTTSVDQLEVKNRFKQKLMCSNNRSEFFEIVSEFYRTRIAPKRKPARLRFGLQVGNGGNLLTGARL